jgi:hypothetical protein
MDQVHVDKDGELYCTVTDTPQIAPRLVGLQENVSEWLPLTVMSRPVASSSIEGREPIYACDESVLTWWQPKAEDKEPTLTFVLGTLSCYEIRSVRIVWRDVGMETLEGIVHGPIKYVVEYAVDSKRVEWKTLIDASENQEDLCIDYRETEPTVAYAVRLKICGVPRGIQPGVVDFTIFGKCVKKD